jgi:hypothetical protein
MVNICFFFVDLLKREGEKASIGVMRGRKGEKHCKTSWFYEM